MERRRALSASNVRPSTTSATRSALPISAGIPIHLIPPSQSSTQAYFKPVLEFNNRAKSATIKEYRNITNNPINENKHAYNIHYDSSGSSSAAATKRPSTGNSSISNRIKSALDHSYAYSNNYENKSHEIKASDEKSPEVYAPKPITTGIDAIAADPSKDQPTLSSNELEGGVNLSSTTPHPEISISSEGHRMSKSTVDQRNNSLDEFPDDLINIDVGLSTVPNKFCTVREALELKKLLALSKGSRGGIVPASSAVMDMYMVGNVIGIGSYGKVRSAWHRLTGGKVAIKTYDKSRLKDQSHWKRVHSEIKITEMVSHPRIARMYEAVETPKRLHLIMECIEGGNLCSHVKQKKRLHEHEARKIFYQLMLAIEYLHTENIAHRDIKLENVLFSENRDIKLIDFGFSTISKPGSRMKIFCGTPSYMAPEIVQRTEYEGPPVDLWAAGVLLFACLCGQFPFRAQSYPDLYRRIARGHFTIPDDLSANARDLIRLLLVVEPSGRMSSSAALKHPWLQTQSIGAPDMSRLRDETFILISQDPSEDIDSQAVAEIVRFGLSRDEVIRLVMTKTHSSVATLYYLFLNVLLTKRVEENINANLNGTSGNITSVKKPILVENDIRKDNNVNIQNTGQSSALATQFLIKNAGGAGVLNLRPRSASTARVAAMQARPMSANLARR